MSIPNVWNSAVSGTLQVKEPRGRKVVLTPNGSPGPTVLQIIPKSDGLKRPINVLSSGSDDDPIDLNNQNGKIITLPDTGNGPITIIKSPGNRSFQQDKKNLPRNGNENAGQTGTNPGKHI